jgi:hypothetical protein
MVERRRVSPRTWRIFALVFGIVALCELVVALFDFFAGDYSGWLFLVMGVLFTVATLLFLHVAKTQRA